MPVGGFRIDVLPRELRAPLKCLFGNVLSKERMAFAIYHVIYGVAVVNLLYVP